MHESQTKMKWKVFYDVHSDFIKMNESIHIIIWRITLFDELISILLSSSWSTWMKLISQLLHSQKQLQQNKVFI